MAISGEPEPFRIAASAKTSGLTPCFFAIVIASPMACTVHAEIKFVPILVMVADPISPQCK